MMSKDELIELVRKIKNAEGTENELDEMILILEKNLLYPDISDLIFFDEKSPEEIIAIALQYKSIQL